MNYLETIIKEAGEIALSYFGNKNLKKEYKSSRDLVSDADRKTEEFLMKMLEKEESISFLGEEFNPYQPIGKDPLWIIDPIDGTTNFLSGFGPFAISIAHYNGKYVDRAACYLPITGDYYCAVEGKGAFRNHKRISVNSVDNILDAVVATGFADIVKSKSFNTLEVFNAVIMQTRAVRRLGSAVTDLLYTADGKFSFFWEAGLSPWDVAAGAFIVKEAGGIVSDFNGENNYISGETIIASNKNFYNFIKKEVEKYYTTN